MASRGSLLLLLTAIGGAGAGSCAQLSACSGRGTCDTVNSKCNCFNGFGSASDIAQYKAPDCSARTCPADRAWVDIPTGATTAHALAECSNMGICDRTTGRCRCFAGYEGEACQRSACPGASPCTGHGKCMSIKSMAGESNAEPFGPPSSYGGFPDSTTWDEDKIQGCVCDSAWPVGYGAGARQQTQWYGPDCSKKRCSGGDDPRTALVDESDCEYYDANGAIWRGDIGSDGLKYKKGAALPGGVTIVTVGNGVPGTNCGAAGNLCAVECSNRGLCQTSTGTCTCFSGYYGSDCGMKMTQQ